MNNNVLYLLGRLKYYCEGLEDFIEYNNEEKFDDDDIDGELMVLIENLMCDLKNLNLKLN